MPGSWIFWIGGIAARVGPKRLTDVKLTTKDKAGLKTAKEVAVQGAVTQGPADNSSASTCAARTRAAGAWW